MQFVVALYTVLLYRKYRIPIRWQYVAKNCNLHVISRFVLMPVRCCFSAAYENCCKWQLGLHKSETLSSTVKRSQLIDWSEEKMLSTGMIVLIVLMVLCGVMGSIYAYLYLTRINPQCLRRLHGPPKHRGPYSDPGASNVEDDTNASSSLTPSTHMFLFRKWPNMQRNKIRWSSQRRSVYFVVTTTHKFLTCEDGVTRSPLLSHFQAHRL